MRSIKDFSRHYFSTLGLFVLGWLFYSVSPFFSDLFKSTYSFSFLAQTLSLKTIFESLLVGFSLVLIPYYFSPAHKSTAYLLFQEISKKNRQKNVIKQHLLKIVLKLFFVPTMVGFLAGNLSAVIHMTDIFLQQKTFPSLADVFFINWAPFILNVLLSIDVVYFLFGYLTESDALKNNIKSVDPSLFGWVVCLLCYPPFSSITNNLVGWGASNTVLLPTYPLIQTVLNVILLLGMAFYTWASISLWAKASNLTSRGIVKTGAYALVRHPAYVGKNVAWWVSILSLSFMGFMNSFWAGLVPLLSGVCWSFIYHLRAITEEIHLENTDPEYKPYKAQVPFRYIKGII